MQSCKTAEYNPSYPSYQYRNLPATFIFSLLSISVYRIATVTGWQLLDYAVYLYVYDKSNVYGHS